MKETEQKATRLVTDNRVKLDYTDIEHGQVMYATGLVTGSTGGKYVVTVTPDGDQCTCPFGVHHPGRTHSHTAALRLKVWIDNRNELGQ